MLFTLGIDVSKDTLVPLQKLSRLFIFVNKVKRKEFVKSNKTIYFCKQ